MLKEFRNALIAALSADLGIEFVPGIVDGPVEGRELGCVWIPGVSNAPSREQRIDCRVRVFLHWSEQQTLSQNPAKLDELDDLVENLQASLARVQTAVQPAWFFEVPAVQSDIETWGVEATVLGYASTPFR